MLKKVFILTQFGEPHSWTNEFLQNVGTLGKYGYSWKIFTENKYENVPENVEIVPMTTDQFNDLAQAKLGVRPQMFMTPKGVPSVHVTDFYPFSGVIFEDYLKGFDFWGIANIDIVFGRLDHFLPDDELDKWDVWSDDINAINGIFCLFRNIPLINNLCLEIPHWQQKLTTDPCPKCMGEIGEEVHHTLFGTDEYDMTDLMKRPEVLASVRYGYPKYYPFHGYDRLETQVPNIKLSLKEDGSLWELSEDTRPPIWEHAHKYFGREIAYYHFIVTKKWPPLI